MRKLFIIFAYLAVFACFFYAPALMQLFVRQETLNVFIMPGRISYDVVQAFEHASGVHVNVQFFENDEELYAKFAITKGVGHDVVLASDYMVQNLIAQNLLAPLDHNQLPHIAHLDSRLRGYAYDPNQAYSVPFSWLTYGIMYQRELLAMPTHQVGLEMVFTCPTFLQKQGLVHTPFKVCLIDEHRELIMLAGLYLFGRITDLGEKELHAIQQLLIEQKSWVQAYTTSSLPYLLLSGVVPVALCPSPYAVRVMQEDPSFNFVVPRDGSLLVIENLAIAAQSDKKTVAHQFVNFLLSAEVARQHAAQFSYFVTHQQVYQEQEEQLRAYGDLAPSAEVFKRLSVMSQHLAVRTIEHLWLSLYAA